MIYPTKMLIILKLVFIVNDPITVAGRIMILIYLKYFFDVFKLILLNVLGCAY